MVLLNIFFLVESGFSFYTIILLLSHYYLEGIVLGGYQFHPSFGGGGGGCIHSLPLVINFALFNNPVAPYHVLWPPSLEQNFDLIFVFIPSLVQGEFWGS